MKRMHVHVNVDDLAASVRFYEKLYGVAATVRKNDYAKWILEDPRVNFAISQRSAPGPAVSHLGIEVDSRDGLEQFNNRLSGVAAVEAQENARCCYAVSDKYWVDDPAGLTWELFHTRAASETYGKDRIPSACCPG